MAADYLNIKTPNRPQLGTQLISLANQLLTVQQLCAALAGVQGHQFNGADYSVFEAQFGLPVGTGANVATLLGNLNTILNTNTDVTGANRATQLQEFINRLAGQ